MIALYDDERRTLIQTGVLLICGACAVLPFTISPASVSAQAQEAPNALYLAAPVVPGRLRFPDVSVNRDPFIPDQTGQSSLAVPLDASSSDGGIGIVLPPNPGASGDSIPSSAPTGIAVRAIVLGDQSRALIDIGSSVRVVGIGDLIGSATVRAIDAHRVILSNGMKLTLAAPQ